MKSTGRVKLTGADQTKYQSMVKTLIPEHPFVRNKEFGNAVLGSVVIAHAITRDLLKSVNLDRTAALSSQPFLWRAFSQNLSANSQIDGRYVGYLLNSFWNDPSQANPRVVIDSVDEEGKKGSISVFHNKRRALSITTTLPITFFAQIKDCEVDLVGNVKILGYGPPSATAFYARGSSSIICSAAEISAESVRVEGNFWFEAESVSTPAHFRIFMLNGAKVGWGESLTSRHPWNEIDQTLDPPYGLASGDDPLTAFVTALARRLPPGASLILNPDFTATQDPRMRWASRQFSSELPQLMRLLIKHGIASSGPLDASGKDKVRVRFDFAWWELVGALENPTGSPNWQALIAEARRQIHH